MNILNANKSRPLEGGPSFSLRHRIFRAIWTISWALLASWTPAPLHFWRRWILIFFGAKLSNSSRIYGSSQIWFPPNLSMGPNSVLGPRTFCYCMDHIYIGEKVVISQGAHLCTGSHDIKNQDFQLTTKPISIGKYAWVAADAFVGPGVTIGEGAVIGARAVLFKDADPYGVYTGNPAIRIKTRVFQTK